MTPRLPLVGEEFAGYALRSVLGRGGMSVVFEAEHPRLGNVIALKVLEPELAADDMFRTRFLKESRIAASLNHPHVVPIYDTGPCDGLLYIAMRFVAGRDLRSVLKVHERISLEQALLLVGQAGRGLDAAHRHGLVHRDVKPANILIEGAPEPDEPDHVYLADFGITKHALSRSGLTSTGQMVGTIDYIAPEQIQGKPVDGRADIYSLGCVLYECLTGRVPFQKDVDAAVIWAHVEERPAPPSTVRPELPRAIDDVIACALAKDPDDRYNTAQELTRAARGALEEGAPRTVSTETSPTATPQTVLTGASAPRSVLEPIGTDEHSSARGDVTAPAQDASAVSGSAAPELSQGQATAPADVTQQAPTAESGGPASAGRDGTGRRRRRYAALLVAAVILAGIAAAVALSGGGKSTPPPGKLSSSALGQVPMNHVTGSGAATVRLNGNQATVTLTTTGLDNNAALGHLLHIHSGGKGLCPPASAARLHNGHLTISTNDGINYYGAPVQSLTTRGDTSVSSILAFARYPTGGTMHYTRTITLPANVAADVRRNNAVVVVHGVDYDGQGIYSGVLDPSELNKSVPGTATAPALCGVLRAAQTASAGRSTARGRSLAYIASLRVSAAPVPTRDPFLCLAQGAAAALPEDRWRAPAAGTA